MQRLHTLGMSEDDSFKLLAMRGYIFSVAIARRRWANSRSDMRALLTCATVPNLLYKAKTKTVQAIYWRTAKLLWSISASTLRRSYSRQERAHIRPIISINCVTGRDVHLYETCPGQAALLTCCVKAAIDLRAEAALWTRFVDDLQLATDPRPL